MKKEVAAYMEANPPKVDVDATLTKTGEAADAKATGDSLANKVNGRGITLSINESGGLRVTYDDGL